MWELILNGVPNPMKMSLLLCTLYSYHPWDIDSFFSRKVSTGSIEARCVAVRRVADVWSQSGTIIIVYSHFLTVELSQCPASFLPTTVTVLMELLEDPVPEISRMASNWFIKSANHLPRYSSPYMYPNIKNH